MGQYRCGHNQPNGSDLYGLCLVKKITEIDLRTSPYVKELKKLGVDYWPCTGPNCRYQKELNKNKPKKVTLRGPPLYVPEDLLPKVNPAVKDV